MDNFTTTLDDASPTLRIRIGVARFDASLTSEFKQSAEKAWKPEIQAVRIDFSKVTFIDSSGIGALLSIQKKVGARGEPVVIENAGKNVVAVIELLRLHRVFNVIPASS